jgi:hypothetical protein
MGLRLKDIYHFHPFSDLNVVNSPELGQDHFTLSTQTISEVEANV